jgi:DNA helicase-2/ATP-dependent DNA helicase PcrA
VFGVTDGIVPHRLAADIEEERRVLHVAITRGRHRVAVLADGTRRSPFLAELAGTAPHTPSGPAPASTSSRSATTAEAPVALDGAAAEAEAALRAWRTKRSRADGVPAYVVVNDRHLRGIAVARPTTPAELVACDGIGPAKLERYGEEIIELLAGL